MTKQELVAFYEGIETMAQEIRTIRESIKNAAATFANAHNTDEKALKAGHSFYKAMQKNRHEAETKAFLKDKIIDLLLEEQPNGK